MDSTLSVKRLFVLVQAWPCIHSWGLHFLKNTPHHHPFLSEKSPQKHSLVISTLLYLLPDVFQIFHLPVLCFQREPAYDCTRVFVKGWGQTENQTQVGGVPKKGLGIRSSVPGALLSHNSHGLMGSAFTVLSVCHFLITPAKDFTSDRMSRAHMREAFVLFLHPRLLHCSCSERRGQNVNCSINFTPATVKGEAHCLKKKYCKLPSERFWVTLTQCYHILEAGLRR